MNKHEAPFWTSYSDLMTSLFFLMLVMFIIVSVMLAVERIKPSCDEIKAENDSLKIVLQNHRDSLKAIQITVNQYEAITKIQEQFKLLQQSEYFEFLPRHKVYVAKDFQGIEIFLPEKSVIKDEYLQQTIDLGKELERMLKELNENNIDLSYLLVIEGNVANEWDKSKRLDIDNKGGYKLSYERALEVYEQWHKHGIDLRKYNTEIVICGSGFNGLHRDLRNENNNKRFTIQILPKVNKIE
jgi:hypothetical protein